MKIVSLIFLLAVGLCCYGQKNNSYRTLRFDRVVIYDFEPSGDKGGSIVENTGQLTKIINKQVQLEKAEIIKLNLKLDDKKSFNWGTAACFDPHLGFVYYEKNKIVGHITICISCNRLYSSIKLTVQKRDKDGLEDAVGMSKSFRQFLNQLLKKYHFLHQIEPGSSFDQ